MPNASRPQAAVDDIALLQFLLVWTGDYNAIVDGIAGPRTEQALTAFLARNRIEGSTERAYTALIEEALGGGDFRWVLSSSKPGDPWFEDVSARIETLEAESAPEPPPSLPARRDTRTADVAGCEERSFGGDGIAVRVTCSDIEGVRAALVQVSGDIAPGDDRYVRQALLSVDDRPVYVSLASNGGDLEAGIQIGRAIWFREAATVVEDAVCASACGLAWLAGRPRYMAPDASIGFHAPWREVGDRPEGSTAASAVVGGYLRDLGLTSAAISYINELGPEEMRWLTPKDADALNIVLRPWTGGATSPTTPSPVVAPAQPPMAIGSTFRDCEACPEMVVLPPGTFMMGSPESEAGHQRDESPRHEVRIAGPLAVGRFEVTFAEWDACVADGGCDGHVPDDEHWGRGGRPVIDVSWDQAKHYLDWLSRKTRAPYRLLTEAEWEYAARAGSTTPYAFGGAIDGTKANFAADKTVPAGSYKPNAFGLYDMHGNVWEWVQDCYHESYEGAPANGGAVSSPGCDWRVIRGGGWNTKAPENLRTAFRFRRVPGTGRNSVGFRVVRPAGPTARMDGDGPR